MLFVLLYTLTTHVKKNDDQNICYSNGYFPRYWIICSNNTLLVDLIMIETNETFHRLIS